ncbi:MAG: ATP-dependent DNA ligase [candidate division WOR-3 bacterium]|nr:MAG: ATP-dependent DNA ligase [candidate division WOR-3 bacterium]
MHFSELVKYSTKLKRTHSKNAKVELIKNFMGRLKKEEAKAGIHYISGRIVQGKINLAWRGLSDLLAMAGKKGPSPELVEVNDFLQRACENKGRAKVEVLTPLFVRLSQVERKHLVALIIGEVQQGAGEGLVRIAIADFFGLSDEEMERAYLQKPDIGELFELLLGRGKAAVEKITMRIFSPVKPMLAQIAESIDDVPAAGDVYALEYKLDGIRIQVHRKDDEVRVFSRHLRDITAQFPELVSVARYLPARRLILDGEAIGIDQKGRPVPFQVLSRRTTRKREIAEAQNQVPVLPQFFDVLYIDGEDMTEKSYAERIQVLRDVVRDSQYRTVQVKPSTRKHAVDFYEQSLARGNEGVMVKLLQSRYRPGKRGKFWFKIKGAHTIDCVILGAEWGHGRRRGLLSNLHLGVFDETRTKYVMVGKTFKGLTDRMLQWLTDTLPRYKVHEDRWTVYVKPVVVVEVAFNEVQKSPKYESGIALRFARVKRIRSDKTSKEINTVIDLVQLSRIALNEA